MESEVNAADDTELTDGDLTTAEGSLTLRLDIQMGFHITDDEYHVLVRAEKLSIL